MAKPRDFYYPTFDELPSDLIYLDELIAVVNEVHGTLPTCARNGHEMFTRSMATNYIKQGLTEPAIGKRYAKDHVARILFAATVKLVLHATDVHRMTHAIFDVQTLAKAHDGFAHAMNAYMNGNDAPKEIEGTVQGEIARAVCAKVHSLSLLETQMTSDF